MRGLADVAREAAHCERCALYRHATQTVFGEGPADAAIMLVGEQPGDQEDLVGRPFVGPAGKILDRALNQAGLPRAAVYVTNAVKHFKFEERGKRRIHQKPTRDEVQQCRWWLGQELDLVKPALVVALGVTAAHELTGRPIVLARERGKRISLNGGWSMLATIHPSAILRMPDETGREQAFEGLVGDLSLAVEMADSAPRR